MLGLRWLLRRTRNHGIRTAFLIDAQAVLGAISKGRSSAGAIKRDVKLAAALLLAGDVALSCAYVPSENNPADEPSRGIVRRFRARASAVPVRRRKGLVKDSDSRTCKAGKTAKRGADIHLRDRVSAILWRRLMFKALNKLTTNVVTDHVRFIGKLFTPGHAIVYHMIVVCSVRRAERGLLCC